MDYATLAPYAAGLVVWGVVFWLLRRRQGESGGASLDVLTQVQEAAGIARDLVAAAEQLWRTGRLERDARFHWVLDQLEELYPGLDPDLLAATVESAVFWLKLAQERAARGAPQAAEIAW